jgi:hypothetical protein
MFELRALHPDIGILHTRSFELRLCLRHVGLGSGASFEPIGCELKGIGVSFHRVIQKFFLCVRAAELEVVEGEFSLQDESSVFEIGSSGLGLLAGRGHSSPDPPPKVYLIGEIKREKKIAASSACRTERTIRRLM